MISVTKLLTDAQHSGDPLRYAASSQLPHHGTAAGKGPVVVWNMTRACNLRCRHCYAEAEGEPHPNELSTAAAESFIDGLKESAVPVLLFSGGEPLARADLFHLARYASEKGIRTVLSTNGTFITERVAARIKESGIQYVGISLDGIGRNNDGFRGVPGAFERAVAGIRNCRAIGQKVGLRLTLNRANYHDLDAIFDFIAAEGIQRVCFYHLVYTGRGRDLREDDLTGAQTRQALDLIIAKTLEFRRRGLPVEILTVDNHADGIYIYNWARKHDPARAERIFELLQRNGGNRSGIAIAGVDWEGNVHPDQFTHELYLGNVRECSFGRIWTNEDTPVLAQLRNRGPLLQGRCGRCQWLSLCNGNFRARALAAGNLWGSDPACYLTDEETGTA
ncbi:radical SAM protein with 4Fe4S-binding SPASM domain [Hydrogenispora ethanolica]|jgi:radical SAM protein with 4Fe4S-binding SPASM domain|uniref:Mycofactocin maturase MftC n=1 Tax=Hydrogenispora ethanolica TaxID=1082276 RepID=A0A4R1RWD6_HYDET|nr:radical SAM protein [Hydrogenispora ethanolica]TCL70906.1 radical SAM protein with 4Fe4S-binding SPASM domain [Hydrogenispora ethanolica]